MAVISATLAALVCFFVYLIFNGRHGLFGQPGLGLFTLYFLLSVTYTLVRHCTNVIERGE
jgi:hypothetical protein